MKRCLVFTLGILVAGLALADFPPLANWTAPPTFSVAKKGGMTTQSQSLAAPFIGLTPCRAYDSRPSHGGPGALANNTARTIALTGGGCGVLASGLVAVSVNITVFDIIGATGNGVFKVDTVSPPTVAWINYPPSETQRSNAGAVAVDASSQIVVQVNQGAGSVDFTVDVNGYYGVDASSGPADAFVFKVFNAGSFGAARIENTDPTGTVYGLTALVSSTGDGSAGVYGLSSGATGLTAGVQGLNNSQSGFARGVLGVITSTAPGGSSAGVRGINNGTGFFGIGVWGSQDGTGYGVEGSVNGTTGCCAKGVYGTASSNTDNTVGVEGDALAGTGVVYGVLGRTFSTTNPAAGVYGVDGSGDPGAAAAFQTSGVRAASTAGYGVYAASNIAAVKGVFVNTAGVLQSSGYLGESPTTGVFSVGDLIATGAKSFADPHPQEPGKAIVYVSLEGPEAGTYFRGRGTISNGTGVIQVPESFRLVSDEEGLTVQITPIGQGAIVSVASADLNSIVVQSAAKQVDFYYLVNGVRKSFKNWDPMAQPDHFMPESSDARMPMAFSPEQRRRLIANGTYNADGTVNMATAERVGWTRIWADRKAAAQAATEKNAAAVRAETQRGQAQNE